jgi:hypothetical protein
MKPHYLVTLLAVILVSLACANGTTPPATPSPFPITAATPVLTAAAPSVFDTGRTAFGFFPSPPEMTFESVLSHFKLLGRHADFILIQPAVPWDDFLSDAEGDSQKSTDIRNQIILAQQNGLEAVFVVDPLNGLNRREFSGLAGSWEASFANPDVRAAITNFALWLVREFDPPYLGLASEINTYADAHPEDFPHFLSLYKAVYAEVKAASPHTKVFTTFQWEDLNNLFPGDPSSGAPFQPKWEQMEAFEPELDLWVISSYPFVAFQSASAIPPDYYSPLLDRTDKLLAVAEGGYPSRPAGPFPGQPADQVAYLDAVHGQLGDRLVFWVYLLLQDFDPEAYAHAMREQGLSDADVDTLGLFASVGLVDPDGAPKPALVTWDGFRGER